MIHEIRRGIIVHHSQLAGKGTAEDLSDMLQM